MTRAAVQALPTTPETATESGSSRNLDPLPRPPAFYAEPPYIGSHTFVGRQAELDQLSDWASPANPHPVLLFEAIGGSGKSMLTWEWATKRATEVRQDWAGRFWYSFYEKGAVMADFCRRALAYVTGEPLENLAKQKTRELAERLLRHLQAEPWLMVLDGLERLLVSYHRFDAAQALDEDAGTGDVILQRDPCAAIRPEDDDLLRALAGAAPSKLLLTSRLTPRVLLNSSGQGIPGVLRVVLLGLRPADAEGLLRSCAVTGSSKVIQEYLQTSCDCHPLVTGVIGGLIREYLPARGDFDAWAADPKAGAGLNLGELDLVQRRNHILLAALDALPEKCRALLSTLSLLSGAVSSEVLLALNPHLPPEPEVVLEPRSLAITPQLRHLTDEEHDAVRHRYLEKLAKYGAYQLAVEARLRSSELHGAPAELRKTVTALEARGLLQYDSASRRYDLHPVVRGVAASVLRQEDREHYGERMVDYFSSLSLSPYSEAATLEDLSDGLRNIRLLLQMGRFSQAFQALRGDLAYALIFNLEAGADFLLLLRPFFPKGWSHFPENLDQSEAHLIAHEAALALSAQGAFEESLWLYKLRLGILLEKRDWFDILGVLLGIVFSLAPLGKHVKTHRVEHLILTLSTLCGSKEGEFRARLSLFATLTYFGRWPEAQTQWDQLDPMGRDWSRVVYRTGEAEAMFCSFQFCRGTLKGTQIESAIELATRGRNRVILRSLYRLRGTWNLTQSNYTEAASNFAEAVRMARESKKPDLWSETGLVLAKSRLGKMLEVHQETDRLSQIQNPAQRFLAELWLASGERELAGRHALAAYKWAWADGEPYVYRYELEQAEALLKELGLPTPELPAYDPAKDPKEPWEIEVEQAIEKLRAKKAAEETAKARGTI